MIRRRIIRTIDANINRICEGLRVLEDISRFILEDAEISHQLKSVRHQLNQAADSIGLTLVEMRDSVGDIGANYDLTLEHKDLCSIVRANAKRVQEGIRVLEELSKLSQLELSVSPVQMKEARYLVYSIEKTLISQLSNQNKD